MESDGNEARQAGFRRNSGEIPVAQSGAPAVAGLVPMGSRPRTRLMPGPRSVVEGAAGAWPPGFLAAKRGRGVVGRRPWKSAAARPRQRCSNGPADRAGAVLCRTACVAGGASKGAPVDKEETMRSALSGIGWRCLLTVTLLVFCTWSVEGPAASSPERVSAGTAHGVSSGLGEQLGRGAAARRVRAAKSLGGRAVVHPNRVLVGSEVLSIGSTFIGPRAGMTRRVEWTVPAGWTKPQLTRGLPGFVEVNSGTCGAVTGVTLNRVADGATQVTARIKCTRLQRAYLWYHGATAPTRAGASRFPVRYWVIGSARVRAVRTQPTITRAPDFPMALNVISQPSDGVAGGPVSPAPAVEIVDRYGNRIPMNTAIEVSVWPTGFVGGTLTATAVDGVARFPDVRVFEAGSGNTLRFHIPDSGLIGATSTPFGIAASTPNQLGFTRSPSSTAANQVLSPSPTVRLYDRYGNPARVSGVPISIGLPWGPQGANLTGTLTLVTNADGVAVFPDLQVSGPGNGLQLSATAPDMSAVRSGVFDITS